MESRYSHLPTIHLKPGEIHFSETPERIATILGSCVTIILYNSRFHISAVCHSVLPSAKEERHIPGGKEKYRYMDIAFNEMYRWFESKGIKNQEIIVKAFGGSNILQIDPSASKNSTIGIQNIEKVLQLVLNKKLRFSSIDLGGDSGRKLYIYTHTGEVQVRRIRKIEYLRLPGVPEKTM